MGLTARPFDDDMVEISIGGAMPDHRQEVVLKPEEARSLADDLKELADRQDNTVSNYD